jgi:hypothetical protein
MLSGPCDFLLLQCYQPIRDFLLKAVEAIDNESFSFVIVGAVSGILSHFRPANDQVCKGSNYRL